MTKCFFQFTCLASWVLWLQMLCDSSAAHYPRCVFVRDNNEKFLAKGRNASSSQTLASSLPPPHVLPYFKQEENCSGILITKLILAWRKEDAHFWKQLAHPIINSCSFDKRTQESALMGELLERETNCHKKHPRDIKAQPPTSKAALYNQTSPTWLLTAQTH